MGFEELARELKQTRTPRSERIERNSWVRHLLDLIRAMPREKLSLLPPELVTEAIVEDPDIIELIPEEVIDRVDVDALRYAAERIGGPVGRLIRAVLSKCG